MSQADISNIVRGDSAGKKKSKRRKKRRTQLESDVESLSSSSSSSEEEASSSDNDPESEEKEDNIELSDTELTIAANEKKDGFTAEKLDDSTRSSLNNIQLTKTELSSRHVFHNTNNVDLKAVNDIINTGETNLAMASNASGKSLGSLKNEYLNMLFEHFGEDVNQLRNAPDFTNKSLVMLANVLKDGGDMFDLETFKTILEDR
ncbi:Rsa3p Ecym_4133 [Eremothecium cymbalariae DBVPG|uniref:Ribosome assembly protein 3 n=1 Tax=Eremothecium cymbalariae (strain CBS 270.75 / DBVPG 7215 / KCTC 17166 / NRRL Y-17582) TaxID=931890 RepID=G8JT59_ERECY|nr:hypothetical protein Ecym_4133 [Eremothecium cymbalariae DBVPG\